MNEERKETDVSQRDDLNKHAKTGKAVKAWAPWFRSEGDRES